MTPAEPVLPPKPEPPALGDCCGGGCARCVHEVYQEELARWEREVARMRGASHSAAPLPAALSKSSASAPSSPIHDKPRSE